MPNIKHRKLNTEAAFTIIEVVLVLAIVGLIFAVLFIGLPAMNRAQRDLRRKQDVDRVMAAVNEYYKHNRRMPYTTTPGAGKNVVDIRLDSNFVSRYIDDTCELDNADPTNRRYVLRYKNCSKAFTSPSGEIYRLCAHTTSSALGGDSYAYSPCVSENKSREYRGYTIAIQPYDVCGPLKTYNLNDFSVAIELENGVIYCVDNS